jgi:hypothetical protein
MIALVYVLCKILHGYRPIKKKSNFVSNIVYDLSILYKIYEISKISN